MNEKSIIERSFNYKNYRCVIVRHPLGHLCGYVGVNKWHELYEVEYNSLENIKCHGGLTYSSHYLLNNYYSLWWIGFDCAHAGDTIEKNDVAFCVNECKKIVDQLENF